MLNATGDPRMEGLPVVLSTTLPEVSLRHNTLKTAPPPIDDASRVAWWDAGQYLPARRRFTFEPALHQGLYYVQEASSMAIGFVVAKLCRDLFGNRPIAYFDTCAAPGGKTTCAIEAMPAGSVVVANEFNPQRAQVLVENIVKHGAHHSTVVTRGDAAVIAAKMPLTFDIVSVDAPCSGEGMMRKEPVAVEQWTPRLVDECAATQRSILEGAWRALKPGGALIYSTCTFNPAENERQLQWLVDTLGAEPLDMEPPAQWSIGGAIEGSLPCMRFIPGIIRGEGLFMAAVRKPANHHDSTNTPHNRTKKGAKPAGAVATTVAAQLNEMLNPDIIGCDLEWRATESGAIHAFPRCHTWLLDRAMATGSVIYFGIETAVAKGKKTIPSHPLAMSVALRRGALPEVDVDTETALRYLRRESLTLPDTGSRGVNLITHGGHPLGFANNLGNRANNLYPQAWRILSQQPAAPVPPTPAL